MKSKEDIQLLLNQIRSEDDSILEVDEEGVLASYHQKNDNNQSLAIKILSVLGGILASFSFLGFLLLAGLHNSDIGILTVGIFFVAGAILINKIYNKIILDTLGISFFIIGLILIGIGLYSLERDWNIIYPVFIVISFGTLYLVQNYILSFVSTLIINGSILGLIITSDIEVLIHVYLAVLTLIFTFFFLKEAMIITQNKTLAKLYNPVRVGMILSFLATLVLLNVRELFFFSFNFFEITSTVIIATILYVVSILLKILNINQTKWKAGIYIFCLFLLLPTALSPAIPGAILIVLLSFLVNYKTGFVLGIIAFIYFISQYYYDLQFTLLTKSILLFSSGVLFIALYLFTRKRLKSNEKI